MAAAMSAVAAAGRGRGGVSPSRGGRGTVPPRPGGASGGVQRVPQPQRPAPVATPQLPPGMSVTRNKPGGGPPPPASSAPSAPPRPAAPAASQAAQRHPPPQAGQQWGGSPYSFAAYGQGGQYTSQQQHMMHQQGHMQQPRQAPPQMAQNRSQPHQVRPLYVMLHSSIQMSDLL